jgi:AcrR family transcriptional regulator
MTKESLRRTYELRARAMAKADTRSRIIAAAQDRFLADHYDVVTLDRVAAQARVTRQTVLNHFDSKEKLFLSAAEEMTTRFEHESRDLNGDPLELLLDEYELVGAAIVRLLQMTDRIDGLDAFLEDGRRQHQDWLAAVYADDLPIDDGARRERVVALHAATDVYLWHLLRNDLGLELDQVRQVLARLVEGALRAP